MPQAACQWRAEPELKLARVCSGSSGEKDRGFVPILKELVVRWRTWEHDVWVRAMSEHSLRLSPMMTQE